MTQKESFALSHNTMWGIVHLFQNGKLVVNAKRFLGYDKDENGELIIVSGMVFCYKCGAKLQLSCWGTGKNKSYIWKCTNKALNGLEACAAKDVKEKDLEKAFIRAINNAIGGDKAFLQQLWNISGQE
jgi:hypothetical protein